MLDNKQLKPFQCGLCRATFSQVNLFYHHLYCHKEDLSPYLHVCMDESRTKEDHVKAHNDREDSGDELVNELIIDCTVIDNKSEENANKVNVASSSIQREHDTVKPSNWPFGATSTFTDVDKDDITNENAETIPVKQQRGSGEDAAVSFHGRLLCDKEVHLCGVCALTFPSICLLHCHMKSGHIGTCTTTETGSTKQSYRYDSHTQTAYPESHQCTDCSTQTESEESIVKKEALSAVTVNSFRNALDCMQMYDDDTEEVMLDDIDQVDVGNYGSSKTNSGILIEPVKNDVFTSLSLDKVTDSECTPRAHVKKEITKSVRSKQSKKKTIVKKPSGKKQRRSLLSNKTTNNRQCNSLKPETEDISKPDLNQAPGESSHVESLLSLNMDDIFNIPMELTACKKTIVKTQLKSPKLEQCKYCMKLYTPTYLKKHTCKTKYYNKIKDFVEDAEHKKCILCHKVYQKTYFDGHTCRVVTKSTKVKVPVTVEKAGDGGVTTTEEAVPRPVYKCKECPAEYPLRSTLRMHVWNRHSKRDLPMCDICGSSFKRVYLLENHIAQHHTKERAYICQICGKNFVSQTRLNLHSATHSDRRQHTCDVCGSTYKTEGNLKSHMRYHKQMYSYTCKYCNKGFIEKSRYLEHFRSHKRVECDNTLGKCDECGKIFKADSIDMHKKLVHNDDYSDKSTCTVCKKTILNRMLTAHMRRRHGVKMELRSECTICGKSLAATGLLRHMKVKHLTPKKPKVKPVKPKAPRGPRKKKIKTENVDEGRKDILLNELVNKSLTLTTGTMLD